MTFSLSFFQCLLLFGLLLIFVTLIECRTALRRILSELSDTNEHLEELKTSVSSIDDRIEGSDTDE